MGVRHLPLFWAVGVSPDAAQPLKKIDGLSIFFMSNATFYTADYTYPAALYF